MGKNAAEGNRKKGKIAEEIRKRIGRSVLIAYIVVEVIIVIIMGQTVYYNKQAQLTLESESASNLSLIHIFFALLLGIVRFIAGYENMMVYVILNALGGIPLGIAVILQYQFTPDCYEYGQYKMCIRDRYWSGSSAMQLELM